MTSGAPAGGGRAWRSTVGGRSISRAAAAIQGASLRTLSLVRPARLASLTNRLELLLAGPPALDLLGESAARVIGGDSSVQRRQPAAPPTLRPVQSNATRSATSSQPAPNSLPALAVRSASMPSSPTGARNGKASLPSANLGEHDQPGRSAPVAPTSLGRAATGGSVGRVSDDATPAPAPALAATRDRITGSALAAAARLDSGRAVTAPGGPSATTAHGAAPGLESSAPDRRSSAEQPSTTVASTSSAPFTPAAPLGGGALGELVGRWQQSESLPELAPTTASRSPFAPFSTATTTGFTEAGRSPDGAGDEVSLDQVQMALDELLRREVEQHGLEGGLV